MSYISFGKYKGWKFKDIPTDYLLWITRQENYQTSFKQSNAVFLELRNRGIEAPVKFEITEHALLRARQRIKPLFEAHKRNGETLRQWLERVFAWILKHGQVIASHHQRKGRRFKEVRFEYTYKGWKFVTAGKGAVQAMVTLYSIEQEQLKA